MNVSRTLLVYMTYNQRTTAMFPVHHPSIHPPIHPSTNSSTYPPIHPWSLGFGVLLYTEFNMNHTINSIMVARLVGLSASHVYATQYVTRLSATSKPTHVFLCRGCSLRPAPCLLQACCSQYSFSSQLSDSVV